MVGRRQNSAKLLGAKTRNYYHWKESREHSTGRIDLARAEQSYKALHGRIVWLSMMCKTQAAGRRMDLARAEHDITS